MQIKWDQLNLQQFSALNGNWEPRQNNPFNFDCWLYLPRKLDNLKVAVAHPVVNVRRHEILYLLMFIYQRIHLTTQEGTLESKVMTWLCLACFIFIELGVGIDWTLSMIFFILFYHAGKQGSLEPELTY